MTDQEIDRLATNLRLAKAAPDMLEALKKFMSCPTVQDATYTNNVQVAFAADAAMAAIAKAEGRP